MKQNGKHNFLSQNSFSTLDSNFSNFSFAIQNFKVKKSFSKWKCFFFFLCTLRSAIVDTMTSFAGRSETKFCFYFSVLHINVLNVLDVALHLNSNGTNFALLMTMESFPFDIFICHFN